MKLVGFRDFDFATKGYKCGIPSDAKPHLSVDANILLRAGSNPTFGPGSIGPRSIPCEFTYTGALGFEDAWDALMRYLNPYDTRPGQLRATRNTGNKLVAIQAVLTLPASGASFSGNTDLTSLPAIFVTVDPLWTAL